ncbi:MAG: U32 family peptidase [Clostridia bacterium]|nr:U32 family peptidase [Clostridia bacterium]
MEILAPAGNYESALAALNNGANAIYLGLASSFSARQGAGNFDEEAFRAILLQAHLCKAKVYVALNTVIKEGGAELDNFFKDLLFAWNAGADAIILQDPFLGKIVHTAYPEILLHLSTQAGVCTIEGAKFAKECGFTRVILARETPLSEIQKIASFIETETFVHGALCTCFSGQCYFSSFAGGNSGNRGRCKQPCRKLYAYNRNGNIDKNYALSLSDLCVGEDIQRLINAGVVSFKIEGRMRRAEYVAAAVRYYRAILDGESNTAERLSDLKRTYNRGNYTKGLAFGQDKRFLSTSIQGHLGEKIGVVKVVNQAYFIDSSFRPQKGDGFKIIRDGIEVGGASFVKLQGKGFIIDSKTRLKNGDSVFITTDTAVNARVLAAERKGKLALELYFAEGEKACAIWCNESIESDTILQSAQNRPLTEEEIRSCFFKTDGLPMDVALNVILKGNVFIPKSELNAFRRKVYAYVCDKIRSYGRIALTKEKLQPLTTLKAGRNAKTAVIAENFEGIAADIAIFKPQNYVDELPISFLEGSFEKYLYYPAFATAEDIQSLANWIKAYKLEGIYAENYGGITFAKEHNIKLFAGTGFNITNRQSLSVLLDNACLSYYAISKELNVKESEALMSDKAFALSSGGLKIMDLCYCPFGKTCAKCDKKSVYILTDENGREFPVRRYVSASGECRFEVYNYAQLIGVGLKNAGQLLDLTLEKSPQNAYSVKDDEAAQKAIYENYTSGHYKRGVL